MDYKTELEECTTDVVIPSSINGTAITGISYGAFNKKQITSVVIPDSVTNISNLAFSNNQLTSVSISNLATSIGNYAF